MSGGLTIRVPITCMCVCVCELQLQIIHITHFDMYYFGLIEPRQCSVAQVQSRYENITHVQYMNGTQGTWVTIVCLSVRPPIYCMY